MRNRIFMQSWAPNTYCSYCRRARTIGRALKPSEVAAWGRRVGLDMIEVIGMTYNPLSRRYRLEHDVSVNYLMAFRKAALHD